MQQPVMRQIATTMPFICHCAAAFVICCDAADEIRNSKRRTQFQSTEHKTNVNCRLLQVASS
jgi:hypothetical protein